MKIKPRLRSWKKILIITLLSVIGVMFVLYLWLDEPLPSGKSGPEADALARKMMRAVNIAQWDSTGAVSWQLRDIHRLLWDRTRNFARVRWEDYEVLVDVNTQHGVAREEGRMLTGATATDLVNEGWRYWVNDAFWLNPLAKLFDPGTVRQLVKLPDGQDGLLITYTSGGVTPGDSYLWRADETGLPYSWQMWVSILPIGGLEFSWEKWITLSTGAKIATYHRGKFVDTYLSDVKAARTLKELVPEEDPFAALLKLNEAHQ